MTKDKDRKRVEDEAGVGPDPRQARHLMPLKELSRFKISGHDPDIRGWSVFTSNGREVGRVDDLLVDTTIGEAVMLDIDLLDSDRHTLAPIRAAWIDRAHDRVILDGAELAVTDELPALGRTAPSNAELERLGERYQRATGEHPAEPDAEARVAGEPVAARLGRGTAADASLPAGSEVIVERRLVSPDEPSMAAASDAIEGPRELRASGDAATAGADRRLVEEVVVRRRYVDAAELEAGRRDAPPDEGSGVRA
ncbi:MAG TPA: PRC-barrel domain-containing protein [Gemmatimonadaceae bacterium]